MIEHAFGERPPLTLGVEEELYVVDAESLEPVAAPAELFDGTRLKAELFRSLVELNTAVCATPAEVAAELATLRAEARTRAAETGLAVGASGTWPLAFADDQEVTPDPGYTAFVEYAGSSARRQFCCGAHVHVGVESPEACLEALEFVLPWLPVLLAVSANSPWFERRETGLASTRAELLTLLPRNGSPPVFASYEDWERFVERLVRLGLADSYRRMWWDVRPHPGFGTLEIRIPDQPTDPAVTVALAALAQALVGASQPGPPADRGVYAQNRWAASRFGPQALLVHPTDDRLVPARELLAELAARLGVDVSPLLDLDQAAEQLETGRREGLHTLCGSLLAR
jgi:carboxylate-amine ligase